MKTQTQTHTPTPWTVEENQYGDPVITVENERTIAVLSTGQGQAKANAVFVVRAVNAHDELINALQKIQGMTEGICHCDPLTPGLSKAERTCDFCIVTKTCKQAIVKAEGK